MNEILARLKPEPVPAVHPVPEYAATGKLADVYGRTRRGLGVPWMGVVAMALAHYPRFYDCLWSPLEPAAASTAFADACRTLRSEAEREAAALGPPGIVPRLHDLGYGPREVDEIRACNEVFSSGNMPYLLMATVARLLLEGQAWPGTSSLVARDDVGAPVAKPVLIEPHHADPSVVGVYADIRESLGLPFVNTDYRAFARWPTYFVTAWRDLKTAITQPDYEAAVVRVHHLAVDLALSLPNQTELTSAALRSAASQDAPEEEVLSVVRLFQWLLPGLVVNVAFFRAQLA